MDLTLLLLLFLCGLDRVRMHEPRVSQGGSSVFGQQELGGRFGLGFGVGERRGVWICSFSFSLISS